MTDDVREATIRAFSEAAYGTDAIPTRVDRFLREFDVRPHGTITPPADEWAEQMDAERARQIEHGYDDQHDAEHGAAHLLNWAIEYARRGNNLAAATMARCALRLLLGTVTENGDRGL